MIDMENITIVSGSSAIAAFKVIAGVNFPVFSVVLEMEL